jgi:hypothetical protein
MDMIVDNYDCLPKELCGDGNPNSHLFKPADAALGFLLVFAEAGKTILGQLKLHKISRKRLMMSKSWVFFYLKNFILNKK